MSLSNDKLTLGLRRFSAPLWSYLIVLHVCWSGTKLLVALDDLHAFKNLKNRNLQAREYPSLKK